MWITMMQMMIRWWYVRSSSADDDATDDEYVDKSTARDLQSRFRTVGGLKGTIADEETLYD